MANEKVVTSFSKKLLDCISDEFKDSAVSMTTDDLRKKMVEFERSQSDTAKDMKNDPKIIDMKENLKALSEGYRDVIKADKASIQYILYILDTRGVDS